MSFFKFWCIAFFKEYFHDQVETRRSVRVLCGYWTRIKTKVITQPDSQEKCNFFRTWQPYLMFRSYFLQSEFSLYCQHTVMVRAYPVRSHFSSKHTHTISVPQMIHSTTTTAWRQPQQQPLNLRRKRSIAYKATQARRTTQQLSWNNLLHSRQQ